MLLQDRSPLAFPACGARVSGGDLKGASLLKRRPSRQARKGGPRAKRVVDEAVRLNAGRVESQITHAASCSFLKKKNKRPLPTFSASTDVAGAGKIAAHPARPIEPL